MVECQTPSLLWSCNSTWSYLLRARGAGAHRYLCLLVGEGVSNTVLLRFCARNPVLGIEANRVGGVGGENSCSYTGSQSFLSFFLQRDRECAMYVPEGGRNLLLVFCMEFGWGIYFLGYPFVPFILGMRLLSKPVNPTKSLRRSRRFCSMQ